MKNKKINLASLKKSLQLFLLFFIIYSSPLLAQTGHWEQLNPPVSPPARLAYGMSSIGNEQALLFSGKSYSGSGTQYFGDTWLFDYQNKIWTELKPKDSPKMRTYFRMCQITKTKVLLFGGSLTESEYFNDTWIFDLNDTSWTKVETTKSPDARSHFGLSQISDNKAILFGGRNYKFESQNDTWLFDYEKMDWKQLFFYYPSPLPDYRIDPMIAEISDKKIILFGGVKEGFGIYFSDTWLFDLDSMKWVELQTTGMTDSIWNGGTCNMSKNKFLIFGGSDGAMKDNTWLFDFNSMQWNFFNLDIKPIARMYTNLVKIKDGLALLFGGSGHTLLGDTWLFIDDINGIEDENNLSVDFLISPNPTTDFIEISKPSEGWEPSEGSLNSVRIFNVFGEKIPPRLTASANPQEGNLLLDVSMLPSGVYFVRVGTRVSKFVKI